MPPKKATNGTNGEASEGGVSYVVYNVVSARLTPTQKFTWEGPNDTKLLLLTQGRYVKTDEYEQLASAFPGMSFLYSLPQIGFTNVFEESQSAASATAFQPSV